MIPAGIRIVGAFTADGRLLEGYPPDERTSYAPRDDVHGLLVASASPGDMPPLPR